MIGWLRRLFGARPSPETVEPATDVALADPWFGYPNTEVLSAAGEALSLSELDSRRLLEAAGHAQLSTPSVAAERRAAMGISPPSQPPPNFQKAIEEIEILARAQVAEAEAAVKAIQRTREVERAEFERRLEKQDEELKTWRGIADKLDKVVLATHQTLTDVRVPPKPTLPERARWLAASRERARRRKRTTPRRRV